MTTQTYVNNSIMCYDISGGTDVLTYTLLTALPDWEGSKIYFLQTSGLYTKGIRQYNIDPDGTETLQATLASWGLGTIDISSGGAAALSYDGESIFFMSETGNSCELAKINAIDLTFADDFGTTSSSTVASSTTRILNIKYMTTINAGGAPMLFMGSLFDGEHDAISASAFASNVRLGVTDEGGTAGSLIGHGSILGSDVGYTVSLTFNTGGSATSSAAMGLYSTDGSTLTKIGTFTGLDVDATWTNVTGVRGIAYDETDGNVIIAITTTDAGPTNKNYIVKLDTSNADVVWTCAVSGISAYSWGMTHSRIRNQVYHYIGAGSTPLIYHIDTSDGSATTETFTGLGSASTQMSDDVTNSIIVAGSFTAGASPPDYLGAWMGTGGHHTVTSRWLRLWFATAEADAGPGDGDGGMAGGLALSIQRAWTFTLDGHVFYVLDLDTEGTFAYDLTTGEWSKFVTSGFGQWDAVNGVMWGIRAVAGDLETPDVWEITPTALTDNDALDISHLVTGGIQTRSRVKHAVSSFRLAGSVGTLGNPAGSTMRLRFSDNNGKTWSAYFDVTLTDADYDGEIAWRSLGAFASPGRVFEISDAGGPSRIDGADAEIDGLDDPAG